MGIIIFGCTQDSEQTKENNKIPTALLDAELTGERLINDLETIYALKLKDQTKNNTEKKNKGEQGKEEQDKGKTADPSQKIWQDVEDKIEKLHHNWNKYESKSSLTEQNLQLVEQKLNQLTEAAYQKKLLLSLLNINQFNLQLAKIHDIYDTTKSQIKKSKGYVRSIIYLAWLKAEEEEMLVNLDDLEATMVSLQEKKGGKQIINELRTAVSDLKRAVQNSNQQVIEIKGQLILDKLDSLETETN